MFPDSRFLDTIVALATPAGRSALAVVRLSGPEAPRILATLAPGLPASLRPRRPHLVSFLDAAGETIDTGLATFFAKPASSTGEDVAELSVHGSPAAIQRLLQAAAEAGARPARPGEFTERAFRSGKIDLVRAEAVRELIEAKTPAAARFSARRLEGGLSERLERVREDLLSASAGLAATIDFSEDVGEGVDPAVSTRLAAAVEALERLAATYETGRLLSNGCRVAILGRPNAGKSTLFNALLGVARAIVTEIPGTTRDTLEGVVDIRGIPVTLIDTAGLRATTDIVEKIGVERAREEAERADAILYVFDAFEGFEAEDEAALALLDGKPRILIANKIDRMPEGWSSVRRDARPLCGLGLETGERLRALLSDTIAADISTEETSEVLGSLRQRDLVERARSAAIETSEALARGLSPEYAVTHCHAALDALADLVGETTSEDVLRRLFDTFCIGK
ncbi:MAG TPA: tRNA uridine-5-carboxymethylaminomethyl(34) synthesis GTPase MnmE [Thermoanaerobaculia bacterium]|jgi:tRNA modification GTPase